MTKREAKRIVTEHLVAYLGNLADLGWPYDQDEPEWTAADRDRLDMARREMWWELMRRLQKGQRR